MDNFRENAQVNEDLIDLKPLTEEEIQKILENRESKDSLSVDRSNDE